MILAFIINEVGNNSQEGLLLVLSSPDVSSDIDLRKGGREPFLDFVFRMEEREVEFLWYLCARLREDVFSHIVNTHNHRIEFWILCCRMWEVVINN